MARKTKQMPVEKIIELLDRMHLPLTRTLPKLLTALDYAIAVYREAPTSDRATTVRNLFHDLIETLSLGAGLLSATT